MGKEFSCTELLAKAGEIMAGGVREEAEVLRDKGEVEERVMAKLFMLKKEINACRFNKSCYKRPQFLSLYRVPVVQALGFLPRL